MALKFADRLVQHEAFRAQVTEFFAARGCAIHQFGVERMASSFHAALVACGPDPTAQFLRFEPDEALIVLHAGQAHLCEIKSTLVDSRTGNLSYELASWEAAQRLTGAGISVFVVFSNGTAVWPGAIRFTRVIDDPTVLARIKAAGRGSGTPFGLFPATSPWLRDLTIFAGEELGCTL